MLADAVNADSGSTAQPDAVAATKETAPDAAPDAGRADARTCVYDCAALGCGLHGDPCGGPTLNCGPCDPPPTTHDAAADVAALPEASAHIEAGPPEASLEASPDAAVVDVGQPPEAGDAASDGSIPETCIQGVGCCAQWGCYTPANAGTIVLACCRTFGPQPNVGGDCEPVPDSGVCL